MQPLKNPQSLNMIPKLTCQIINSLDRKVLTTYHALDTYHFEIKKNTALEKDVFNMIVS